MRIATAPIAFRPNFHALGILWLAYAVLRAASAVWIVLYSGTLTVMWGALLSRVPNPLAWMTFFHFALAVVVVLDIVACAVSILAGLTLLRGAPAARSRALVAAFFALINGPLGIALGAFTLAIFALRTARSAYSDVATAA